MYTKESLNHITLEDVQSYKVASLPRVDKNLRNLYKTRDFLRLLRDSIKNEKFQEKMFLIPRHLCQVGCVSEKKCQNGFPQLCKRSNYISTFCVVGTLLLKCAIPDLTIWLRTGSNPTDISRFQSHTGKKTYRIFFQSILDVYV